MVKLKIILSLLLIHKDYSGLAGKWNRFRQKWKNHNFGDKTRSNGLSHSMHIIFSAHQIKKNNNPLIFCWKADFYANLIILYFVSKFTTYIENRHKYYIKTTVGALKVQKHVFIKCFGIRRNLPGRQPETPMRLCLKNKTAKNKKKKKNIVFFFFFW